MEFIKIVLFVANKNLLTYLWLFKRPSEKGWITSKGSHCVAFECLLKRHA